MTDTTLSRRSDQRADELTLDVTVVERILTGEDTLSLTFMRADGEDFPQWLPGSHVDLHLGEGVDGDQLIRQYSIWSDPKDRQRLSVGILKDPKSRGGSVKVHDSLHTGTNLRITGPRNNFTLEQAERYVLFAGGIGITPIISMARQLEKEGKDWTLYYLARSRERFSLLNELATLPEHKVVLHSDVESGMFDAAGVVSNLGAGNAVYACGPGPLLNALETLVETQPGLEFHCERFVAAVATAAQVDLPFDVVLARSGKRLTIPSGKSCLEVLRDAGVAVNWSCKEGTCGTCEQEVLDGIPEHRDVVLTPTEREENETMMVCVSRAKTASVTLDL